MRFLLWLIILAALAVGVAFVTNLNSGYALLIIPPYRIDLSLNLFIVYLVITVVAFYLLLKLLSSMLTLPGRVRRWRERRKQVAARKHGYLAMIALVEGRMQRVERAVEKALLHEKNADARLVVTLTGAKAAHVRGDFARRDKYLQDVEAKDNTLNIAAAMLKAEMLADAHQDLDALQILAQIRKVSPQLISAMRLELRIQQREAHALRVIELADKLEKLGVFDHAIADRIRHEAYLQHVSKLMNVKELKDWWHKLPQSAKCHPLIALVTAQRFVTFEDKLTAAKAIEDTLDKVWDATLLDYYGRLGLQGLELMSQLQKTEGWLKGHAHDAQLLLTLGRLCAASELWGKAQSYFEASLAVSPSAVTHAELGHLLERLEQHDQANQHYRRSLEFMIKL